VCSSDLSHDVTARVRAERAQAATARPFASVQERLAIFDAPMPGSTPSGLNAATRGPMSTLGLAMSPWLLNDGIAI
jgi:hypothetical protein